MIIIYKFSRVIFTLLFIPFWHVNAQQSSPIHVMYQDIAWAPDNSAIYFSAMKVKHDFSDFTFTKWSIYKYDLNTGKITTFADSALNISVSSNKQIAFGKIVGKEQDIWIVDSTGKNIRPLTSGLASDCAPSWSPDGKQIVFNRRNDKGRPQVFTINANGTGLKQLTNGGDSTWSANPVWSPDGKHIVYYQENGDRKDQIFVINPDGSGKTNITKDTLNNFYPSWVDSSRIVFARSYPNDSKAIFLINMDGTDKTPLFTLASFYARYSNDGSLIAYIDNQNSGIHIINSIGQEVTKIILPL